MKKFTKLLLICSFLFAQLSFVQASSPRMHLVECYTSGYSPECKNLNENLVPFLHENSDSLLPLMIHTAYGMKDLMYRFNKNIALRENMYVSGTNPVPYIALNGSPVIVDIELESLTETIDAYSDDDVDISMWITQKVEGDTLYVDVICQSDASKHKDLYGLFIVLTEKHIVYTHTDQLEQEFYWVARQFYPGHMMEEAMPFKLLDKDRRIFKAQFYIDPEYNRDSLEAIAFVQQTETKEVLQSARALTPEAAVPQLVTNNTLINFGNVSDSRINNFSVTNMGFYPLEITKLEIETDYPDVYRLKTDDVEPIESGQQALIDIQFFPLENIDYSGTLKIYSNDPDNPVHEIELEGRGRDVLESPYVELSLDTIDFGMTNEPKEIGFTIRNLGKSDLIIDDMQILGKNSYVFELAGFNAPDTIGIHSQKSYSVTFDPVDNLPYDAEIIISSNDPEHNNSYIQLLGSADDVIEGPGVEIHPDNYDFGDCSESVVYTMRIYNSGNERLSLDSVFIEGDLHAFRMYQPASKRIDSKSSVDVNVEFFPRASENYSATFNVLSDAENHPHAIALLTGSGVDVQEFTSIEVDAENIKFGLVEKSLTKSILIRNTGTQTIEFESIALSNDTASVFNITSETLTELAPGMTSLISIIFEPKDNVGYTAKLKIISNASNAPVILMDISGTGKDVNSVYAPSLPGLLEAGYINSPVISDIQLPISLLVPAKLEISLHDINGNNINAGNLVFYEQGHFTALIPADGLPSGTYFLRLETGGKMLMRSFVVTK